MIPTGAARRCALALAAAFTVSGCGEGDGGPEYKEEVQIPPVRPPVGAEEVFRKDQVLTYTVTISRDDYDWIEEHGVDEEWQPTKRVVVSDGEGGQTALLDAEFRHKGNIGTLQKCWSEPTVEDDPATEDVDEALLSRVRDHDSSLCKKISYKLKFDKDALFHGLRKVNLHAMSGDPTKLHELLAYGLFNDFAVDAPRVAPAMLSIDVVEEDDSVTHLPMGLFLAVEDIEEQYPRNHFAEAAAGNLIKDVWPTPRLLEDEAAFREWLAEGLETNDKEPDVSDFVGFTAAVRDAQSATFEEAMAPWVDLDQLLRYMAVDRAIRNWDGVTALRTCSRPECRSNGPKNLFWYDDQGATKRFHLIPWDMDNTLQGSDPIMHPTGPDRVAVPDWNVKPRSCAPLRAGGPVTPPGCDKLLNLLAETQWSRYQATGRTFIDTLFKPEIVRPRAQEWARMIEPLLAEDPYVDLDQWRSARDELIDGILQRAAAEYQLELNESYVDETR